MGSGILVVGEVLVVRTVVGRDKGIRLLLGRRFVVGIRRVWCGYWAGGPKVEVVGGLDGYCRNQVPNCYIFYQCKCFQTFEYC